MIDLVNAKKKLEDAGIRPTPYDILKVQELMLQDVTNTLIHRQTIAMEELGKGMIKLSDMVTHVPGTLRNYIEVKSQ